MSQRIVIRDDAVEAANRVMEKTKLGSLTEVISIMFSRYGRHLEESWEVLPAPQSTHSAPESPAPADRPTASDFNFTEPLTGL